MRQNTPRNRAKNRTTDQINRRHFLQSSSGPAAEIPTAPVTETPVTNLTNTLK